ncbi:unnamed protein product [Rhizophagus irregularis]|uniref:Mediator of RNA polymerase II transcription subunit 1 n=1 Tax=Rhizophagus irregularis TaxID=588596 RepID=A0A2N1NHE8_9GLOM|nr:hypothetical protein RhiirC2_741089 [Rhizophagus irregularis]CAB4375075.1 unnamed protein product [Rhizophagus irregularis]CAB5305130.1 unnamed protein product [Rhizophagus irregularis]
MTETEAKSIHTLIRELQSIIKNSQEQWGLNFPKGQGDKGDKSDKSQTNIAIANAVHTFGPVNLNELFEEIPQKITLMREIITQFKNNMLTGIQGSEQSLSNYINQLKKETERLDSLAELKDSIKTCKSLALDACHDNSTAFKFIIQQIESLGKQLGLLIYHDTGEPGETVLTMSGAIIVLDIKYDEILNRIIKVVVSYATDARQNDKDDRVNNLLTQQLSDFKQFNLFKKNLETLKTLETMSKLIQPVDCFHCIKCISNDIKTIYEKEFAITNGDVQKILTEGHGIPLFNVDRVGPSIAYWAPKHQIMEIDWKFIKDIIIQGEMHESFRSLHRMWISMEKSRTPHLFLPPGRNQYLLNDELENEIELMENYYISSELPEVQFSLLQAPLKFLHPKEDSTIFASALIEFVVWLDPPVYVSDNVARHIGSYAGIVNRGYFVSSAFQKKDPQTLSLEQLLIEGIIPPIKHSSTSRAPKIIHQWEKKFDDSLYLQVFNLDSKCNTKARRIDRIPFSNLFQVYGLIKILRQQLLFNKLYQSCFNSSTYKQITITRPSKHDHAEKISPDAEDAEAKIQIKVQTINSPTGLSLDIQLPSKIISPQITIHLSVTILHEDSLLCYATGFGDISNLNEELTGVLQTYQDIPMLINHLLNSLLKPQNVEEIKIEETKLEETKLEETKFEEMNIDGINIDLNLDEIEEIESNMMIDENVMNSYII